MSPTRPQGVHSTDSCNEQDLQLPASTFEPAVLQPLVHDVPAHRAAHGWNGQTGRHAGRARAAWTPRTAAAGARRRDGPGPGPGGRKRAVYTVSVEASVFPLALDKIVVSTL